MHLYLLALKNDPTNLYIQPFMILEYKRWNDI